MSSNGFFLDWVKLPVCCVAFMLSTLPRLRQDVNYHFHLAYSGSTSRLGRKVVSFRPGRA